MYIALLFSPVPFTGCLRAYRFHFTSLHFTSLPFPSLPFPSLPFPSLPFTSLHFTSLDFTSLHFTSLHFTSPHLTSLHFTSLHYAQDHDTAVAHCFTTLLDNGPLPATALAIAHLPLSLGGLGLTSATLQAQAAHWASWANAIPVLQQQAPTAVTLLQQLQNPTVPALQAATASANSLTTHGWEPPEWVAFTEPRPPAPPQHTHDGPNIGQGWQHQAATAIHTSCHQEFLESLDPPSRALLESQSGPHASRAFTTIPSSEETTYPSHLYSLLLLRRSTPTSPDQPFLPVPSRS